MKKNYPYLPSPLALRRFGVRTLVNAMLASFVAAQVPVVHAQQQPGANQATLNFVGADIESVVKAVGHYTKLTFIVDPRVKGTINLVAEKPVSKAQAFQMLTQTLRLQGYAVVNADGVYKVVPEADAKLQGGPMQASTVRGDQIATQVFRLNYENAVNLVPVLRPLISPNNTINANAGTNSLVVTDYADNLRRIGRIVAALDNPATSDLDVVPIKHAIATDMAVTLNRLLEPGPAGPGGEAGRIGVMADSRTNSVIIRAPSAARANLAKSLIAKLDTPTVATGNVHVVHLRNAEATRLAQTLRAVVASDSSLTAASTGAPGTTATTPAASTTTPSATGQATTAGLGAPPSSPASQQGPLPTGGAGGFIQADAATNTLIITANEAIYRNLRAVIDKLDARRAQVYVESLIVEVSSNRAAEFGIQWAGLSGDANSRYRVGSITGFSSAGNNMINQAVARATTGNPVAPGNGMSIGIFRQIAGELTLGAIARALESDADANILSMPNLVTLDNEEARIIVGQNVPFITGQYTTAASGGGAGVNPFQTVERRDIGLSLRVRPQISEGGTVRMAIYQETSAIQDTSNSAGLITSKRSIDTNVLVDDGQIIVLGGLIDDNTQGGVEKVPGLGDVPVLGNFFKYQRRSRVKTNLMVFLRPIVVRSNEQSVNVAGDRYSYIRNAQYNAQPQPSWILPDLGAPQLPPMEDGRIEGSGLMSVPPEPAVALPPQSAPAVTGPAPAPSDPALDLRNLKK
ncbi:type II secretion system secretin GspD [Lacisediminimonas profundi]|uniref:type II secretion system secretin GspD n=1 Tax=Lacisediminimonas profundi TaxID=2603856 RepID=UPI00124BA5F8|nr:type II secretion system secretin GspD [Lacisediminimonas profundi]